MTRPQAFWRIARPTLLVLTLVTAASAAPVVSSVMNGASNIAPQLPNGAIAPGSIFIIKGTGLGPANLSIAPTAFQSTSLSGTSVKVAINNTTVDALMYYTSDKQVAALLPSNTPTGGPGTITVTYNGQSSPATPIRGVAASNVGIFTIDSSGSGVAIITYPDYSLVSSSKASNCGGPNTTCGAANPGDTLILWATGLGAINGSDAAGAGLGQNMPNIPLSLWIGGVQAEVVYQGRSGCCIGEDQIVFRVPETVPLGCQIPLAVRVNNQLSNSTVIATAKGTRDCQPADAALAGVNVHRLAATGPIKLAYIDLNHILDDDGASYRDTAHFIFAQLPQPTAAIRPFFATLLDSPPVGTCSFRSGDDAGSDFLADATPLDAGTAFMINSPNGTSTFNAQNGERVYLDPKGNYLRPGNYIITGTGGKDVGSFTANTTIPALPRVTTPASSNGFTITRGREATVTWNPNGSTGHVEIILRSETTDNSAASIVCSAPASAGSLTVPAYLTLALPAGTRTFLWFGLGDWYSATSALFTAPGTDIGIIQSFFNISQLSGFTIN